MCMAKQIFFDDFNKGRVLDASKWSPVWGKFDPNKGTQMQFTDKNISIQYPDNLWLLGTVATTQEDINKAPFLSAMVNTRKPDKGEILFQAKGQFAVSVKAKLPAARSSWPGIWMTGTKGDWPACGEIDILEAKGWDKKSYQANVHTPRLGDEKKSQQKHKQFRDAGVPEAGTVDLTKDHHLYSVVKLNDRVDFYFDGGLWHTVKYSELDIPTPFTDPENGWIIRLSHIIGGSFLDSGSTEDGHDQYVDATKYRSDYPSTMMIDYVRVVSLDEEGDYTPSLEETFIYSYLSDGSNTDSNTPIPPSSDPVPPTPSPQPPTPARPEQPVVVVPTPAPVPKPKGERAKGDWVREVDALVFIML